MANAIVIIPTASTDDAGECITFSDMKPDTTPEHNNATSVRYSAPAREFSKNPAHSAEINEIMKNEAIDRDIAIANFSLRPNSLMRLFFIKNPPKNLS